MTDNINSINFLPEYLRTDKNAKFLSATLDQWIQPAQLERIYGYIGSKTTPTYSTSDIYISEISPLREEYQLVPALVINDSLDNIQDVISYVDLINEINIKDGNTTNLDRLFRSEFYSYDPHIDWDKFINFQDYYWLPTGPAEIEFFENLETITHRILGQVSYVSTASGVTLTNGLRIRFINTAAGQYYDHTYYVEGVGTPTGIRLINDVLLVVPEKVASSFQDGFGSNDFDYYKFDDGALVPILPEYITINRASQDLNSWSRYNRWVHADVIRITAESFGQLPVYPANYRAQRPIIEFAADLVLYNHGTIGIPDVDFIDNVTLDPTSINDTDGYFIDQVLLEKGNRIIFNAADGYQSKIYQVDISSKTKILTLTTVSTVLVGSQVTVTKGVEHHGTNWHFDGIEWKLSQQHTVLNQFPLFDLFDKDGNSYGDKSVISSNFTGSKIFGYSIGTVPDPYLGLSIEYKNVAEQGEYLFSNYFMTDLISIVSSNQLAVVIPTSRAYLKFANLAYGERYVNVWTKAADYKIPITNGYYDVPLGQTNNPLNGVISQFTFSELYDHVKTMVARLHNFSGIFPGIGNLRDLPDASQYGTRLISNANPLSFAGMFIGKKEHSVIDAITLVSDDYNRFKAQLVAQMTTLVDQKDPVAMLEETLSIINKDKTSQSPYHLSDMLGYGVDKLVNNFVILTPHYYDHPPAEYPISSDFSITDLSLRSILLYLNGKQLVINRDYKFIPNDSYVSIYTQLLIGDTLTIVEYPDTSGCYIPPTPSKLGLYPVYIPSKYIDESYNVPRLVIQGHDGSITVAYDDFRDDVILEFETRVYNNIKAIYRPQLFDINSILPGAFRSTEYNLQEINDILQGEFTKWAGSNSIDYATNDIFDQSDSFTWNYLGGMINPLGILVSGNWRSIYKFLYDTDRPDTHPWEIFGFTNRPDWWDNAYGGNRSIIWSDASIGLIRGGDRAGINPLYARPNIVSDGLIPVDDQWNLKNPTSIISNTPSYNHRQNWKFGDQGPAETAWRRSSYWPFAFQRLIALTKPAVYSSIMYDLSRVGQNSVGQWTYGTDDSFFKFSNLAIHGENNTLTSGYSVMVSEAGSQHRQSYISQLRKDLEYASFNLFYKVGGFVSKDTIQLTIDAYEPVSNAPGGILTLGDYNLRLNISNSVEKISISGMVIQKASGGNFIVLGYDTQHPYFIVYTPMRSSDVPSITIGGISEPYVNWTSNISGTGDTLSSIQTTSAAGAAGLFYKSGQIVYHGGQYYRVVVSHQGEQVFNPNYYQVLSSLPTEGGATVITAPKFNRSPINIPYGSEFSNIQQVYDVIVGYGAWLEDKGFIFDQYNQDINDTVNWEFSGKEFLYWTTQNWSTRNIITLSPFADQIKYSHPQAVVNSLFDPFYGYSLLLANGSPFPATSLFVNRQDGVCTISATTSTDGIYFATLNCIQKEHSIVFNNRTIFNDVIYDSNTGYQQKRMKISGFRTQGWRGDLSSPGFVYDNVQVTDWQANTAYLIASVVRYNSLYYSAISNVDPSLTFDATKWIALESKPTGGLLPNFDYKINQFRDFYSLDIDNFDPGQQKMAQHLTGYTPRKYLNYIFSDPIAQYKFYQGFILDKGTANAIKKLARTTIQSLQGNIDYTEEWAFRVGEYGSYSSYSEIENSLVEGTFLGNPSIVRYVNRAPDNNDQIFYSTSGNWTIIPDNYDPSQTFYVSTGTYRSNLYVLPMAGYVRFDDITLTVIDQNNLLTAISNISLNQGDTVWVGFSKNNDWDVLRYHKASASIVAAESTLPGYQLTFTTDVPHGFLEGELILISQYIDLLNGAYIIQSIESNNKFVVSSKVYPVDTTLPIGPGQIFVFSSSRISVFDNLPDDSKLLSQPAGTLYWIDSDTPDGNGKWVVYNKTQNHQPNAITNGVSGYNEELGYSISQVGSDNLFMVGSPQCSDPLKNIKGYGKVTAYVKTNGVSSPRFRYFLNQDEARPYFDQNRSKVTGFGQVVVYDDYIFPGTNNGMIFAGAPLVSYVKLQSLGNSINIATLVNGPTNLVEQGLITISNIAPVNNEENRLLTLASPYPQSYEHFGSNLYVQRNVASKLLLVGAIGTVNSVGTVYAYNVRDTSETLQIAYLNSLTAVVGTPGMRWGHGISGSDDASTIAISAPGYMDNTGMVAIFTGTIYQQIIHSPFGIGGGFGKSVEVSPDGSYLIVGAPDVYQEGTGSYGKVAIYTKENGLFDTSSYRVLTNPAFNSEMRFGSKVKINTNTNILAVSALGINYIPTRFDDVLTRNIGGKSIASVVDTIDDAGTTGFFASIEKTGTVYVYNRDYQRFVLAEEISPIDASEGTDYGYCLTIDNDNTIFIGAPATDNPSVASYFYQCNNTGTSNAFSWEVHSRQENLTNIETIKRVTLIDTFNEEVVDYLEAIDPAKGKISGLADQEIRYKSMFDPAVYSIGTTGTVVNTNTNWVDNHVGEIWWDLSTVKYVWSEQGDLEYRRNNWGGIFPGTSIDVYEWVGSKLLPSQWNRQADTPVGLTQNVSGVPKHADDTVLSIKTNYDPLSGSFSNVYYYWVKNTVIIPSVSSRRISAKDIANLIFDPVSYGIEFVSLIAPDAIILSNVSGIPVSERINLNISMDLNPTNIPKHTEWVLLQENSATSLPNPLLEKKLLDSLIGHDDLGNLVPDPALSPRQAYGICVRPRQSLFKNRFTALQNLIEFSNSILIKLPVTGNYSFKNLNSYEVIPNENSRLYDLIVETVNDLNMINTTKFIPATVVSLLAEIENGKVIEVVIANPGIGYLIAPIVKVEGNCFTQAVITTSIDGNGSIISVKIDNPGAGYYESPTLVVRPYTVVVSSDIQANGLWSINQWDAFNKRWDKIHTQLYDTRLYWNYVDYVDPSFSQYKLIDYVIDSVYELPTIGKVNVGQYIKIKNIGDNRSAIITPSTAEYGTFGTGYDLLYSQNGTIQLSDALWNAPDTRLGFDELNNFDITLYNQAPDLELGYLLSALRDDIFIGDLAVNWNLFFFTAVKYCLSEQKFLDWAFKTNFINVTNYAGVLDQRPVYNITTSTYFEQYINEVKPYHTQIRTFTTNQTALDTEYAYNTDFDLPSFYNTASGVFQAVSLDNSIIEYAPWDSWDKNYGFSVSDITITNPGSLYTRIPEIVISPPDLHGGTTATAVIYIGGGRVSSINITNQGYGYTKTPTANLIGGTTGTTATVYLQIDNKMVRTSSIALKFDSISVANQMGSRDTYDAFICDGSKTQFVLSWLAHADKQTIDVTLDGDLVLTSDYTIWFYTESYNGYDKRYSKLVFLNYIPKNEQVLRIHYKKSADLMTAYERLGYFTSITDFTTVTSGLTYPGTVFSGVMFDHTSDWSQPYPAYDEFAWADAVNNYTSSVLTANAVSGAYGTKVQLESLKGIRLYQYANVISTTSAVFEKSTVVVIAIDTSTNQVTLNSQIMPGKEILSGSIIEFWDNNTNFSILDVDLKGGAWSTSTSTTAADLSYYVGALGIDPVDIQKDSSGKHFYVGALSTDSIIVDGDGFYTENTGVTPNELILGQASDSLGVNVYTKNLVGSPTVINSYFDIKSNMVTSVAMTVLPPDYDSITVSIQFNTSHDIISLDYSTSTTWTSSNQFSIDWVNSRIVIAPQPFDGIVGYTILLVDGSQFVDYGSINTYNLNTNTIQVRSLGYYDTIAKSAYVTLDGITVPMSTGTTNHSPYFTMSYVNNDVRRAAVDIHNVSTSSAHLAQAWFFNSQDHQFNQVHVQTFKYNGTKSNFELLYPPGNVGPLEGTMIVEVNDGGGYKRMRPPSIVYYQYKIGDSIIFPIPGTNVGGFEQGAFNANTIKVYRNGIALDKVNYNISDGERSVELIPNVMFEGDVLAIISYAINDTRNYDFRVNDNVLTLSATDSTSLIPLSDFSNGGTVEIKVITYTDHDNMLMNTETFVSEPSGLYKISRPVFNSNYVWISVNGEFLINPVDFVVLSDQMTIRLSDQFTGSWVNEVIISSLASSGDIVLGYRIFTDMVGRTQFKRLSKEHTTYLTRPLYVYNTEIHVNDASVLSRPLVSAKIPGVIIIEGERIEYYKVSGNVLSQLRRGTLGTAPRYYAPSYTKVIDQGVGQTITYSEHIRRQTYINIGTTNTYIISPVNTTTYYDTSIVELSSGTGATIYSNTPYANLRESYYHATVPGDYTIDPSVFTPQASGDGNTVINIPNQPIDNSFIVQAWFIGQGEPGSVVPYVFRNDGIVLQTSPTNTDIPLRAEDQVSVYYGGRLLRKDGIFVHDTTVSYDSPVVSYTTATVDSAENLPQTRILNTAFITTDTNKVWVYTASDSCDAINGYIYQGLNYLPSEFTINTSTRALTLNIPEALKTHLPTRVDIVKRDYEVRTEWNDPDPMNPGNTLSIMQSTSTQAQFLRNSPAQLPDGYYYGGDNEFDLADNSGFSLTMLDDDPLMR
jgi:hypothetical protein